MALYLISYDIDEKDKSEYEALWAHLRNIGAVKVLYSEWVVKGSSASAIYDGIAPFVKLPDRLLVVGLVYDAMWDKLLITNDAFSQLMLAARAA